MKAFGIIFVLLIGVAYSTLAQIVPTHEYHKKTHAFCTINFTAYSDSSFELSRGCEHHRSIQVGYYAFESDTFYLHPVELNFNNFIDSIVYVPCSSSNDTIDIIAFDKNGISFINTEDYIFPTQALDSMNVHDLFLYSKGFDGIQYYYRNPPFQLFFNGKDRAFEPTTYILNRNEDYSLALADLSSLLGKEYHVELPRNTCQIFIYYSKVMDILMYPFMSPASLDDEYSPELINCDKFTLKLE